MMASVSKQLVWVSGKLGHQRAFLSTRPDSFLQRVSGTYSLLGPVLRSQPWIIKCSYSPTSQVWGIPSRHPRAIYLYTDNRHITNDILHNLGEAPPTPAFWWAATEYKLLYHHAYFMLSLPFVFPERNRVTRAVHCHNSVEWYGHRATPALLPCNWELVPHAWPARDKWPGRAGALALCHQGSYSYVIQKPSTCTVAETSLYPLL